MTDYQTTTFEQSGAVARITLNRPDVANGMNSTMTRELAGAAARCDTPATKVVVITGAERFLCRRRSQGLRVGVKALLLDTFSNGLEQQMELEGRLIAQRPKSADGREGADAFLAKCKPEFG